MEADLRHHYHLSAPRDLLWRDRAALIRHLPSDSAIGAIGRDGPYWSVEAHLLDENRMWMMALAGVDKKYIVPHPQRPKSVRLPDPARLKKLAGARRRARERKRKIEAGEII